MKSKFNDFHGDWQYSDPAMYGTFGLGGGGAGSTGGQENDGGAGPGGMNEADNPGPGGDMPGQGTGTDDHGYDGDGEPGYNGGRKGGSSDKEGEGGGHDPLGDLMSYLKDAEGRAHEVVKQAIRDAEAAIKEGREEAAGAIIRRAKMSAHAILEREGKSIHQLNRFWNQANWALTPIIRQGRFADNEIASMLGIPNAKGEIVPFDLSQLEATPGYQFEFQQGQKALSNSAVGTALSGAHAKAQTAFGQGMARTYFDQRIGQLQELGQRGTQAAMKKGDLAYGFGSAFSDMFGRNAALLQDTHMKAGLGLADVHTRGMESLADIHMRGAETRVGLITGLATAATNLKMAEMGANATLEAAKLSAEAQRRNSRSSLFGTALGTAFSFGAKALGWPF